MVISWIPTHKVAQWLLNLVDRILSWLGLTKSSMAEEVVYTVIILGIALLAGWLTRKVVVLITQHFVYARRTIFTEEMEHEQLINKSSHIIPPLVFMAFIPFAFQTDSHALDILMRIVLVYFVLTVGWTICSVFNVIWVNYNRKENTKNLPLKGILNVAKGLVWMVIAIISVALLVDRSPAALLTGLGAFAAALMLIFKDSILGFVAGLQLSANDMLRVGDWIAIPGTIVNGIVTDVSLTAVKVRNWDNTTVTVPPYTLVSTQLQNWNKMKQRGRRQIQRSILIDISTIRPTTPEMLEDFKKLPFMKDYIEKMQKYAAEGEATSLMRDDIKVNGSIDTNLGVFRAYTGLYLHHHPWITMGELTCMVRELQQTPQAQPLELFCYTNTADWVKYEGIQSDIFEHLMAAVPAFGLSAYSAPSSRDVVNIGNPKPEVMPYNGNSPVPMPAYDPKTNWVIPPNTSGDPGFAYNEHPVYPANIADMVADAEVKANTPLSPSTTPTPAAPAPAAPAHGDVAAGGDAAKQSDAPKGK